MKFSERIGKTKEKSKIQIDDMDQDLRVGLWNIVTIHILERIEADRFNSYYDYPFRILFNSIWHNFFKLPIDTIEYYHKNLDKIRKWFFESNWYDVYNFIEFLANNGKSLFRVDLFIEACNKIFERELSGYRFVGDIISPITNEIELNEIEGAIENSDSSKLKGTHIHVKKALEMLSDKKHPDYRNSIKESISAIESISELISGESKAELGKALHVLSKKINLHGALISAFKSLYGYTSDEGGIRHAMLDESNIEFEDAKYMLVSCSAFINYLIMKSSKHGINIY